MNVRLTRNSILIDTETKEAKCEEEGTQKEVEGKKDISTQNKKNQLSKQEQKHLREYCRSIHTNFKLEPIFFQLGSG